MKRRWLRPAILSTMDVGVERAVRAAAFEHLRTIVDDHGVASWGDLKRFTLGGEQIFLVGSGNGIFKPRQLSMPISILTTAPRSGREPPYDDAVSEDDYLLYRYRGTDPNFHENRGLRELARTGLPLIHFHGVDRGRYVPSAAVIVHDDPASLTFSAALMPLEAAGPTFDVESLDSTQRSYQLRMVRARVHQQSFRERVLKAYGVSCALCRLNHRELLDAAHIIPDTKGGEPIVPNGLALCKIHHAAYDTNILGIRPDLVAEIRPDIMSEIDGPMLAHGLQALNRTKILVPRSRQSAPSRDALEQRYEEFRAAS